MTTEKTINGHPPREESVVDVFRQMREHYVKDTHLHDDDLIKAVNAHYVLLGFADQAEAAWERESIAIATAAATEAVKYTNEKWEREGGDAAKMCAVLCKARQFVVCCPHTSLMTLLGVLDRDKLVVEIDDAIAAPPRNCDVYTTTDEARWAYHMHGNGLATMQAFCDWFLAPVNGGTSDGRK